MVRYALANAVAIATAAAIHAAVTAGSMLRILSPELDYGYSGRQFYRSESTCLDSITYNSRQPEIPNRSRLTESYYEYCIQIGPRDGARFLTSLERNISKTRLLCGTSTI